MMFIDWRKQILIIRYREMTNEWSMKNISSHIYVNVTITFREIPDEKLRALATRRATLTFDRLRRFDSSDPNIEPEARYVQPVLAPSAATWTLPRVGIVGTWERSPSGADPIPVTRLASDCLTFPQERSWRGCTRARTHQRESFTNTDAYYACINAACGCPRVPRSYCITKNRMYLWRHREPM